MHVQLPGEIWFWKGPARRYFVTDTVTVRVAVDVGQGGHDG
jgi:hypothetical protein